MPKPDPNAWQLDFWADGFYSVYSKNDDQKSYSRIWLPVTSHASRMSEAVRVHDYEQVIISLGNAFAWILSFAGRFKVDLGKTDPGREIVSQHGNTFTEWVLHKYPTVCNVCGASPCKCATIRDVMELRHDKKKAEYEVFMKEREPRIVEAFGRVLRTRMYESITLPGLFDMFESIYGGTLWGVNFPDVAFHFLEEVGEVSKEIGYLEAIFGPHTRASWEELSKKNNGGTKWEQYSAVCTGVTRELADVFSWTTAICYKVGQLWPQAWPTRETLVKLYAGEIPSEPRRRQSVMIGEDRHRFRCRYCTDLPCTDGCIEEQLTKRLLEGIDETTRKFHYEKAAGPPQ